MLPVDTDDADHQIWELRRRVLVHVAQSSLEWVNSAQVTCEGVTCGSIQNTKLECDADVPRSR